MDNQQSEAETPNLSAHIHHYVLKGSGLSCWAECNVMVRIFTSPISPKFLSLPCGHKLAGDNGPIVGSRAKVEKAMP